MSSCSIQSAAIDESLSGTAPANISFYVLLEYSDKWPSKINLDSLSLPKEVSNRISKLLLSRKGARLQLIRRPKKSETPRIFIVDTEAQSIHWADYNADWSLDDLTGFQPHDQPLILVCTHGVRDACCAKNGGVFFRSLRKLCPEAAWQSSHLGGHRFAATAIHFPSGRLYGRLKPIDAPHFTQSTPPDLPERLRGLTRYDRPTQYAETQFLKQNQGNLSFESQEQLDSNRWRIRFRTENQILTAVVHRKKTDKMRHLSCSDSQASPVFVWSIDND